MVSREGREHYDRLTVERLLECEEELVICSIRLEDHGADGELVEDFWPVNGA